jgi:hemolysin-activating ACP:hemolysin acyltransferase
MNPYHLVWRICQWLAMSRLLHVQENILHSRWADHNLSNVSASLQYNEIMENKKKSYSWSHVSHTMNQRALVAENVHSRYNWTVGMEVWISCVKCFQGKTKHMSKDQFIFYEFNSKSCTHTYGKCAEPGVRKKWKMHQGNFCLGRWSAVLTCTSEQIENMIVSSVNAASHMTRCSSLLKEMEHCSQ